MSAPSGVDVIDALWLENVSSMPCARILIEHLAYFTATITYGGVKGMEASIEQTSTWRRTFCYEYFNGNAPLGIKCNPDGKLPKCIGIMNLSGKHCIFHSESYTLAKVVCLSSQEAQQHIISSVNAVLSKADDIGASVLFCFCLPFQAGLERAHWDIRTIRKTARGAVKDGELCFSSSDIEPRTVPCTRTLECLPDAVLRELVRKLRKQATPICLDKVESDEIDIRMTPEVMETMIEVLKSDRRKMIDSHKQELEDIKVRHGIELANAKSKIDEAEQDAAMRIAKVAHASKATESTMKKKIEHLEANENNFREQLLTQQNVALEAKASLAGHKLEREQEANQAAARQKTLEAQVSKFRNEIAKQTTEQVRARKDQTRLHAETEAAMTTKIADLNVKIKNLQSASLAVQASSNEAYSKLSKLECKLKTTELSLETSKKNNRVMLAMLALAKLRMVKAVEESQSNKNMLAAQHIALNDATRMLKNTRDTSSAAIKSLKASLKDAEAALPLQQTHPDDGAELMEAKREMERKDHLLSELDKRTRFLEKKLTESNLEIKKLSSEVITTPQNYKGETCKRSSKKGIAQEDNGRTYAHNTISVSQNTSVFMAQMAQPPHQQAFPPTGQYTMDPALENTISQLHSALNCITAMARSSTANSKQAEMAKAKLDALFHVGIAPQAAYYDSGYGYTK